MSIQKLILATAALAMVVFAACDDDEKYPVADNQKPIITLDRDTNHVDFDQTFPIAATIDDLDGLKTIQLTCKDLFLNKTINLQKIYGDTLRHYNLSYKLNISDTILLDEMPVLIQVTDLLGNVAEKTLYIMMDGDNVAPSILANFDDKIFVSKDRYQLKFKGIDNSAISSITVKCKESGFSDEVSPSSDKYTYTNYLRFPVAGSYNVEISIYDSNNNEAHKNVEFIKEEITDFPKMYLSDVETEDGLTSDVFGVPMLITRTGEHTYHGEYYNSKAGTPIRFLPQKNEFQPFCIGLDPDDSQSITTDPEFAKPIILNEISYYEFDINIKTKQISYRTKPFSEISDPYWDPYKDLSYDGDNVMFVGMRDGEAQPLRLVMAGDGWIAKTDDRDNGPWWNTRDWKSPKFQKDPQNPYRFTTEIDCNEGSMLDFTITVAHWWGDWKEPFWRFEEKGDDAGKLEYNTPAGGNNTKARVPATGTYKVIFDAYLRRTKVIPAN